MDVLGVADPNQAAQRWMMRSTRRYSIWTGMTKSRSSPTKAKLDEMITEMGARWTYTYKSAKGNHGGNAKGKGDAGDWGFLL